MDMGTSIVSSEAANSTPRLMTLKVNEHEAVFKIYTEADITVLLEDFFQMGQIP